jgi:hypothetical protein
MSSAALPARYLGGNTATGREACGSQAARVHMAVGPLPYIWSATSGCSSSSR